MSRKVNATDVVSAMKDSKYLIESGEGLEDILGDSLKFLSEDQLTVFVGSS